MLGRVGHPAVEFREARDRLGGEVGATVVAGRGVAVGVGEPGDDRFDGGAAGQVPGVEELQRASAGLSLGALHG